MYVEFRLFEKQSLVEFKAAELLTRIQSVRARGCLDRSSRNHRDLIIMINIAARSAVRSRKELLEQICQYLKAIKDLILWR